MKTIKVKLNKKNEFKDDYGNTFKTMNDMLAYHGIIFASPNTNPTPIRYVYIDDNGNEITMD